MSPLSYSISDRVAGRVARRLLVVATTGAMVASLLLAGALPVAAVPTVDHFGFATIGNQTAGQAFTVTVTAYGPSNNPLTSYGGGATLSGTLGTSPACSSCAHGSAAPAYGAFGTWLNGSATATVTGYLAQAGVSLTATDSTAQGTSNTFDVARAAAAHVDFADIAISFNGQPATTKRGTPIYSYCAAGGNPCGAGSLPVKVIVRDDNGNPEPGLSVTLTAIQNPGTAFTGTTAGFTGTDGIASFGSPNALLITPSTATGPAQLHATVTSGPVNDSGVFQIVDDLDVCSGASCVNDANSSNGDQTSYGTVTTTNPVSGFAPTSSTLAGVTLVTQFQGPIGSECAGALNAQIGRTADVHVEIAGGTTTLNYQVALIIPKTTLQATGFASRNASTFNVCFGATYLLSGTPSTFWQAKTSPTNSTLTNAVADGGLYWGWLPDCSVKKNPPTLDSSNPCISLRTKNANELQAALGLTNAQFKTLGFSSGDLAIVYQTRTPWDAKGSLF